jgi:hypothetical protein
VLLAEVLNGMQQRAAFLQHAALLFASPPAGWQFVVSCSAAASLLPLVDGFATPGGAKLDPRQVSG